MSTSWVLLLHEGLLHTPQVVMQIWSDTAAAGPCPFSHGSTVGQSPESRSDYMINQRTRLIKMVRRIMSRNAERGRCELKKWTKCGAPGTGCIAKLKAAWCPLGSFVLPTGALNVNDDTFFFEPFHLGTGSCQEPCTRALRSRASRGLRGDEGRACFSSIVDTSCDDFSEFSRRHDILVTTSRLHWPSSRTF